MVSINQGRLILAKSRRLLVTSKRLLQDLEDQSRGRVAPAQARNEAPSNNLSGRFQTNLGDAEIDEKFDSSGAVKRELNAASAYGHRPRRPR
jgi:hypothetical protein